MISNRTLQHKIFYAAVDKGVWCMGTDKNGRSMFDVGVLDINDNECISYKDIYRSKILDIMLFSMKREVQETINGVRKEIANEKY
jgi:hypothetical protein